MSRNLGKTACDFCSGAIVLEEKPRPILPDEAGCYYGEFAWLWVCNAHCADCEAKYLAWMIVEPGGRALMLLKGEAQDLSFRSTFDDEPGEEDLPEYEIETVRRRVGQWQKCSSCDRKIYGLYGCQCRSPNT